MKCFVCVACVLLFAIASFAAEPAINVVGRAGPFAEFPWLHVGLRLNYKVTDVTARGRQVDEREDGTWPIEGFAGAGVAVDQFTVVGINDKKVATTLETYLHDLVSHRFVWQSNVGQVVDLTSEKLESGWLSGKRLDAIEKDPPPGFRASRVVWSIGDRKCDALYVRGKVAEMYLAYVYDRATGLLLHMASKRTIPPGYEIATHRYEPGGVKLRLSDFVSARDVTLPWTGEEPPAWVGKFNVMQFAGQSVLRGQLPGVPSVPKNGMVKCEVTAHEQGWIDIHETLQFQNSPPVESDMVWSGMTFGSGWLGPKSLQRLHRGDVVDKDPLTGVDVKVTDVGANSITITQSNGVTEQSCRYDLDTGMINAVYITMPGISSDLTLRRTSTQ